MRYEEICKTLGIFFLSFSAILLIPLCVGFYYDFFDTIFLPYRATVAFGTTIGICLAVGSMCILLGRRATGRLFGKESILVVALIWLLTAAIGALPLLVTRVMHNPIDAYFEAMSALTTTGATLLHPKKYDAEGKEVPITIQNPHNPAIVYTFYGTVAPIRDPGTHEVLKEGLEALGPPLLFWITFMQWLGGIGIVVVFLAALPSFASAWKFLYEIGITGPSKESLTPRIKDTLSILCIIYVGMTAAQIILLEITNPALPLFQAITLAFATISTGGFTIFNDGLAHFHHTGTLVVVTVFMVLGSLNFSLYYSGFKAQFRALRDPELFVYLGTLFVGSMLLFLEIGRAGLYSLPQALGYSIFQAVSAQSSTGFAITNYDSWPVSSQTLLLLITFLGGMSGSTAGGMKIIRLMIVVYAIKHQATSFFRPNQVQVMKIGQKEIPHKTAVIVLAFFCLYALISVAGTYLLVLENNDPFTSLGVIATCINNTGCYFEGIGSTQSLAFLTDYSKLISIFFMILGRLELFALLVILAPSFWSAR